MANNQWWRETTIYQIYPRSFYDTTGNGTGDLAGVIEKLDYLKNLGVETLWLSPFYASPGLDHGYDISDYYAVDPLLGTEGDAERLIEETHRRGMRIIFDMVMNHTSDQHAWFLESRADRTHPKRDWYIWQPGKQSGGKKPPNNWRSMIGRRGWNYDRLTDEWYYASFLPFQPDLNWENPEVREAMFSVVRYWLGKGVDGFRLDIFNCLGKNREFPDNPFYPRYIPTPDDNDHCFWQKKIHNFNHPDSFRFAKDLRKVVDEFPDRFLVGEVSGHHNVLRRFLGEDRHDGLHLVFQFELLHYRYRASFWKKFIAEMERDFPDPYLPTLVYGNHDIGRGINRVKGHLQKARLLALLQLTLRGVPCLYYGDEIGMGNHRLPIRRAQDPLAAGFRWVPHWLAHALDVFINRDDARTPMQWDASPHRGFTTGTPWLATIEPSEGRDVASQTGDPESLLESCRSLLRLRSREKALRRGSLRLLETVGGEKIPAAVVAYERSLEESIRLIVVNFSGKPVVLKIRGDLLWGTGSIARKGDSLRIGGHSGGILTRE